MTRADYKVFLARATETDEDFNEAYDSRKVSCIVIERNVAEARKVFNDSMVSSCFDYYRFDLLETTKTLGEIAEFIKNDTEEDLPSVFYEVQEFTEDNCENLTLYLDNDGLDEFEIITDDEIGLWN